MEFEIAYKYRFTYVPKGHQNDRYGIGDARITIEIPTLSDEDAPIALKVGNPERENVPHASYSRFLTKEDGNLREVRILNDKFYVESHSVETFSDLISDISTLSSTFLTDYRGARIKKDGLAGTPLKKLDPTVGGKNHHYPTSLFQASVQSGGLREDKSFDDYGEAIEIELRKQASKMFIHNGTIFEQCREPVFVCDTKDIFGIVEAQYMDNGITDERYTSSRFNYKLTSGLEHARGVMKDAGLDYESLQYEIMDTSHLTYDGVATDVTAYFVKAFNRLKTPLKSTSLAMVQAYFSLQEALSHMDYVTPTLSAEMIDAAIEVSNATDDPDISERMNEINKMHYFNTPCSETPQIRRAVNYNKDTVFEIDMTHISEYRDEYDATDEAINAIKFGLKRWEDRAFDANYNINRRMMTIHDDIHSVTEVGSRNNARFLAIQSGISDCDINSYIEKNAKIYRIGTGEAKKVGEATRFTGDNSLGVVIIPYGTEDTNQWEFHPAMQTTTEYTAEAAFNLVASHIEIVRNLEIELAEDDEEIMIFSARGM